MESRYQHPQFTLDEFASMMRENKPYLLALEELVTAVNFGTIDLTIKISHGIVEEMEVISKKKWQRPRAGHSQAGFEAVVITREVSDVKTP